MKTDILSFDYSRFIPLVCSTLFYLWLPAPEAPCQQAPREFHGFELAGRLRLHSITVDRTGIPEDYTQAELDKCMVGDELYDPKGFAVGGNVRATTPSWRGFRVHGGYYYANSLGLLSPRDATIGRSGKDTFYTDRLSDGTKSGRIRPLSVMAESYAEYQYGRSFARAGRFIFNTPLTDANDTKMIPNTFQGYWAGAQPLPSLRLTAALLVRQKLRDRNAFHRLLQYGCTDDDNDDSAMHRGLTVPRLRAAGIRTEHLYVYGLELQSFPPFLGALWNYHAPQLYNTTLAECAWTFHPATWSVTPAVRFVYQRDNGAGAIGGATLDGLSTPAAGAAEGRLAEFKCTAVHRHSKIIVAHSHAFDQGDLILPFRGFPTGTEYTRTMTEVNWEAGTSAWTLVYVFDGARSDRWEWLYFRCAFADNNRLGRFNDSITWYGDIAYTLPFMQDLTAGLRVMKHTGKAERSFNDIRVEVNQYF